VLSFPFLNILLGDKIMADTELILSDDIVSEGDEDKEQANRLLNLAGATTRGRASKGQQVSKWFTKALEEADPNKPDGKLRIQLMFERMYEISINRSPKRMKEAIWAFNALMDRAYGPPIKDISELEAMAKSGNNVAIQVITLPPLPVVKPEDRSLIKPEFDD
jgi:hypothetical protein